jgi:hypothetical protein
MFSKAGQFSKSSHGIFRHLSFSLTIDNELDVLNPVTPIHFCAPESYSGTCSL